MYFGILFLTTMLGIIIAGFCGLMPADVQPQIPYWFRFLGFMIGGILPLVGMNMLMIRAKRTGADELMKPGRVGTILWFFIYRDGEVRITPAKRAGEGQLYNDDLESQIIDVKTYSLADHKIRFVPEVLGHAANIDFLYYVNVLKTRYGFDNLREARAGLVDKVLRKIGIKREREIIDSEHIAAGEEEIEEVVQAARIKNHLAEKRRRADVKT